MQFSPAFTLLPKFSVGLKTTRKDMDDVLAVSEYLGIDLPDVSHDDKITILAENFRVRTVFFLMRLFQRRSIILTSIAGRCLLEKLLPTTEEIFATVRWVGTDWAKRASRRVYAPPPPGTIKVTPAALDLAERFQNSVPAGWIVVFSWLEGQRMRASKDAPWVDLQRPYTMRVL